VDPEKYIGWTEIGFITLSEAILSFLEYHGVDPEMDTALFAPKLASYLILKTKLVSKMCKCGSGNEHCVKRTEICYMPLKGNKTGI